MKLIGIAFLLIVLPLTLLAQDEEKKFGVQFSGFIKNDMFFDSRQTVTARDGHFLLWPAAEKLDPDGNDINDKSAFNMLAIQTRVRAKMTGPDVLGAKTSGMVEGAFFAMSNATVNSFRLRHAFVKLNWTNTELLFGQTWHPMFITGCFPGTVSFNTGVPFQPFSRNPQIRLTQNTGDFKFVFAVQSQLDFTSRGPAGISSTYLRNSATPDMHAQIHYGTKNAESGYEVLTGAGLGYKSIVPEIETAQGYQTDETVAGLSAMAFLKVKLPALTFKVEGAYGENACDYLSLGGFAVKEVVNQDKGLLSYTPISVTSFWTDIHSNGKKVQVGVFAGYSQNNGAKDRILPLDDPHGAVYGLGTNLEYVYRISPRVIYNVEKVRFAMEFEHTAAAYASEYDEKYKPTESNEVANNRMLFSVFYFF